jgi:hypothetical protein
MTATSRIAMFSNLLRIARMNGGQIVAEKKPVHTGPPRFIHEHAHS